MGNSIREQLLKAGVVDTQRAKAAEKASHKKRHLRNKGQAPSASAQAGEARKAAADKAARDRELNRKRNDAASQRALAAQIRQLVAANRISRDGGEIPFHFTLGSRVKKLWITAEIQQGLTGGRLAIVNCDGRFEIVPADTAAKVAARNPRALVELPKEASPAADDPYAQYQIPDDLTW